MASRQRKTKETEIEIILNLDGEGKVEIEMDIPFFPHLLTSMAFHAGWDLRISASGDVKTVDAHHTVEDVGIVLGETFAECLGDKRGIKRFATVFIPMDDALSMVSVDCGGRAYFFYDVLEMGERVGEFETALVEEFFRAFTYSAKITLHAKIWWGKNNHHCLESLFKAAGKALHEATTISGETIPSTKGLL
ncbi:MAG: imidazoleglycerol-phosphate dehydratase HisB [Atribacterota bacterium]|nr:imidazoleglycerol-phosphate dehydratase HisB [Atribacterota bacterium]